MRVTASPGFLDSAAAIVAISAPTKAKIAITTPLRIAKPPLEVSYGKPCPIT